MAKKANQVIENVGTIWQNSNEPDRMRIIRADEDLKKAFEEVLWVNNPLASREMRRRLKVVVDAKLNAPVAEIKGSLAGFMSDGWFDGKTYMFAGFDLPLYITAQIYVSLVDVFSDCNPERAKECQKLYEHFKAQFLANAIPVG